MTAAQLATQLNAAALEDGHSVLAAGPKPMGTGGAVQTLLEITIGNTFLLTIEILYGLMALIDKLVFPDAVRNQFIIPNGFIPSDAPTVPTGTKKMPGFKTRSGTYGNGVIKGTLSNGPTPFLQTWASNSQKYLLTNLWGPTEVWSPLEGSYAPQSIVLYNPGGGQYNQPRGNNLILPMDLSSNSLYFNYIPGALSDSIFPREYMDFVVGLMQTQSFDNTWGACAIDPDVLLMNTICYGAIRETPAMAYKSNGWIVKALWKNSDPAKVYDTLFKASPSSEPVKVPTVTYYFWYYPVVCYNIATNCWVVALVGGQARVDFDGIIIGANPTTSVSGTIPNVGRLYVAQVIWSSAPGKSYFGGFKGDWWPAFLLNSRGKWTQNWLDGNPSTIPGLGANLMPRIPSTSVVGVLGSILLGLDPINFTPITFPPYAPGP